MKKILCGILFVLTAIIGYRVASECLEESRDFR
ncbi:uncharacterized protein YxeA [Virgibacillus halotolerans]|nr:uncharacterized protein YxeA [Virgibacillus halotolerans]